MTKLNEDIWYMCESCGDTLNKDEVYFMGSPNKTALCEGCYRELEEDHVQADVDYSHEVEAEFMLEQEQAREQHPRPEDHA